MAQGPKTHPRGEAVSVPSGHVIENCAQRRNGEDCTAPLLKCWPKEERSLYLWPPNESPGRVEMGPVRGPIPATEIGLAVIFISRSLTRIYQRRAVELYGVAGMRAAQIPGSGLIPAWVSFVAMIGWTTALLAGVWLIVG
jgi:hypothetical protein